MMQRINNKILT